VDDDPPVISDVTVSSVRFSRATITWLTDEPSDSCIWYGTSTPDQNTASTILATGHSLAASYLLENTTYYFWVESTDEAGNTAVDDNGSAYYTFRTTVRPPAPPTNEDWPTYHNNEARVGVSPTFFMPPLELVWQGEDSYESVFTSPVEADGKVVSATMDGYLRARDGATGTILWEQWLGDYYYFTGVPAIADGVVYTVFYGDYGGAAYALDLMTGGILWEVGYAETGLDLNARIALAYHDGLVFGHSWDGYTYALDATDGTVLWTHFESTGDWVYGLSVSEGMVFVTARDGAMYALDEYSGDLVWRMSLGGEVFMSPMVSGGVAYAGTYAGALYALDSGTGDVIWTQSGFGAIELSTPAFDGSALYFGSLNYSVCSVDAVDGSIIWYAPTYASVISAVVYAGGYVYAVDESGALYSIDASTGDIVDTDYLAYMTLSSPAVSDGWIWVEDYNGRMYAFKGLTPVGVDVSPASQEADAVPGTTIYLDLTVTNVGFSGPDTFDIDLSAGTGGWSAEMFYSDGVTPVDDTDGDLIPDTDVLAFEESAGFVVAVTVPSGAVPGDSMGYNATFTSSNDLNVSETATMTVSIPPPGVGLTPGAFQQLNPGESAMVAVEVTNTGATQDTIDMTILTSIGWATGVYFSDGTTHLTDTDFDGTMDVGALSGLESITVMVAIDVPSDAEEGAFDRTVLTGSSSLDPAQEDSCNIITEVPAGETTDWPQFRHDSARGGVAPQDYEGPLELNWTYVPVYESYSVFNCPVIGRDTVFLVEASGYLTALDLATGGLKWQTTIGYPDSYGGTAAVAYGYVYSVFIGGYSDALTLSAVDEYTGEVAWSQDYYIGYGIASPTTPAIASGMVFWSELESGIVHANDAITGEELWAYDCTGWVYQGPTYWAGMVFVATDYGYITALDAFTGEALWTDVIPGGGTYAAPTVADGVVYVGDYSGQLLALDPFTGEELWSNTTGYSMYGASPLAADGMVFACGVDPYSYESGVKAFDAATGWMVWDRVLSFGAAYSSPAYNNGTIYCMFESGEIFALDAETGDTVQYISILGYTMSSPAIANGHLVAADYYGDVYTFNFQDVGFVTSLETDPEALELEVATSEFVSAAAYDAYGNPAEDPVFAWQSVSGLGTIVPITENGDTIAYVAGTIAGADTLECSCSGVTATVEVTILPGTGDRLEIYPEDLTVVAGEDYQFSASVTDMFGNELDGDVITWTSSAGVISSSGLLTASTVAGSGTVTAHAGTVTAVASVTIVPDVLAEIVADPAEAEVTVGSDISLSAEGHDQYGNVIADAELTWSTDRGMISALTELGTIALFVAPTTPGTATANVSSGDLGADVELTIVAGDIARIEVDPAAVVFETGETAAVNATAVDIYGNELEVDDWTWSTTIGSVTPSSAGDSAELVAGDEPGSGTVTVSASGESATVSVTVLESGGGMTTGEIAALALGAAALAVAVVLLVLYLLGRKRKGGQDAPPESPPPAQ
jgi:outer membrane protein assembly factor BamB